MALSNVCIFYKSGIKGSRNLVCEYSIIISAKLIIIIIIGACHWEFVLI